MPRENYCILLFLLGFSSTGFAQQYLFGRITKKGTTEILIGVNLRNLSREKYNESDMGGNYKIPAGPGDSIVFSSAGYLPDTLIVDISMFSGTYPIALTPNMVSMPSIEVNEAKRYRLDSLQRREDYGFIYDKKHPVKLWNEKRPGDEPGFSFSPIGFFSTTEKETRRLKKRLEQEEEDYYIDYKFPRSRVAQLTRLSEDSLQLFMMRYRPSYQFCRSANSQDILFYINDKLKIFRNGK